MHRTQPQALTTEELLDRVYAMNYNVPVDYVMALCDRLSGLVDAVQNAETTDPRQLELPL